ncbi:MAG: hypothetical protein KDC38_09815 [Planctomycetes bacterium]|nr:hypothetical protein [Planctomycetota bacterium]
MTVRPPSGSRRRSWIVILVLIGIGAPLSIAHADSMGLGVVSVSPGIAGTARLTLDAVVSQPILGYSLGVEIPTPLAFDAYLPNPALSGPSEFVGVQTGPEFVGIGVVFSTSSLVVRGPGFLELGELRVTVPALSAGQTIELPIVDGQGSPPISVEVATVGGPVVPDSTLAGGVLAASAPISQVWVASTLDDTVTSVSPAGVVGTTIASGGLLTPNGIAVDPNGVAWIAYRDSDTVRRVDALGTEVFVFGTPSDVIVTGDAPTSVAISSRGNAWVGNAAESSLTVVNAFGRTIFGGDGPAGGIDPGDGVIGPAINLDAPPLSLAADASGSMWIAASDTVLGFLYRVNRSGSIGAVVPYGAFDPVAVAVDRAGFAWVCLRVLGRVERVASDGSLVESFNVPSARAIAVRRRPGAGGAREAWVVGGLVTSPALYRLRPGGAIDVYPLGAGSDVTGLAIDGRGLPWISRADGSVALVDPTTVAPANPLTGIGATVGSDALILGDSTAYTQAFVQFPDGDPAVRSFFDFDGDGYVNTLELEAGSDVFDALDDPSATVPILPVQGLTCTNDGTTVQLSWTIPVDVDPGTLGNQSYSSIEVRVDDVPTATQPGPAATSFSFALPASGTYSIEVIGSSGAFQSPRVGCSITAGSGAVLASQELIFDGDLLNPFDVSTGPAGGGGFALLGPTNPTASYITDPQDQVVVGYSVDGTGLFQEFTDVFDGNFGATGCAYVDQPGGGGAARLYIAGGAPGQQIEIRAFEVQPSGGLTLLAAPHLFVTDPGGAPVIGPPGGLAARPSSSGGDDVLLLAGPDGCELLAVLAAGSGQAESDASFAHPNPGAAAAFGLNGVALIDPFGPSGGTAWVSDTGSSEGQFTVIEVSVAGGVGTPTGMSLSFQLEDDNVVGGFDFATNVSSLALVLDVVGVTTSTLNEIEASVFFIRGDANGDGTLDVADVISMLSFLFQGGELLVCETALDGNDSGDVNVADAIYLLSFLFTGGPPPPAPYPDPAGGDPFDCVAP